MVERIKIVSIAKREIREAVEHYKAIDPELAADLRHLLEELQSRLLDLPLMYPVGFAPPLRKAQLARFPYSVHYLVEPNFVVIFSFFHNKRDPQHLVRRLKRSVP